ncbi:MAG: phage terminase large subunit family protein, partial [Nitrospirota bacterium]|nr:phage terminase large subunit family protein [Nitrospirota bacterium]
MTATFADPRETYVIPFREALKPPPDQTVWEWSDEHRVLSQVASAEPGRWITDRTPYLREILECLSPSCPVRKVIFRKSAQVGGTEAGNNWVAFVVDMVGGPMLIVQPTVELAKRWSKQRLAPMIRDTPRLHGKITDARSRDSGNTMLAKEFPGGILIVTGANSAIGLRSMPAASLFFDEVDAYPDSVNGEGHAIELGERRAQTFPFRKVFEVSTPKLKYASRIDDDFETSDRAYFYVPCPKCDTYQRLVHTQLVYEEETPHAALYACGHCGELLSEGHKTRMLAAGQWFRRMEAWPDWVEVLDHGDGYWGPRPLDANKPAGFHIDAMYSPVGWFSWGDVAKEKEAAKKDEARAISFQNTILGLPYEEHSDAPDWKRLHENRLTYRMGLVPPAAGV